MGVNGLSSHGRSTDSGCLRTRC